MHVAFYILLGLFLSLYLLGMIVAVVEVVRAPMGYEDNDGFHLDGEEGRQALHPPLGHHLPLGGMP